MAIVRGTAGADRLRGTTSADELYGLAGNDRLIGRSGADLVDGGAGFDTADYATSSQPVQIDLALGAGSGGEAEGDRLLSIEGIVGSRGDDTLLGAAGGETLDGGLGNDTLDGGEGSDSLFGKDGADRLAGGGGDDRVEGGSGDDFLDPGAGRDRADGGSGRDTFQFRETGPGPRGVYDGGSGTDTLNLEVTAATAATTLFEDEYAAFQAGGLSGATFTFTSLGLQVRGFERVSLDSGSGNNPPSAGADQRVSFAEDTAPGTLLATVTGSDPDAGTTLAYSLTGGNAAGLFAIDADDGEIRLAAGKSLDFETTTQHVLTVTVSDGTLADTAEVTIDVTDVNEAPSDLALSNATVAENAAGAVVGLLTVTDPDAGDTHGFAVDDGRFEVVGGQLKLRDGETLDFEAESTVEVEVTATDAGGLAYSENFTIDVTDEAENEAPSAGDDQRVSFAEDTAAGTLLATVTGSDPDAGTVLAYSLTGGNAAGLFAIDADDGELRLAAGMSLDFETTTQHVLTVTVSDGTLTDTADVTIDVTDVQENRAPTLIQLFGGNVEENAAGAEIGTLVVTDPDAGDTHSFTVDDARFEIVGDTLKLKAGVSLDHESDNGVAVEVTATDSGGLAYSETYNISVTDNNEAPTDLALVGTSVDENLAGAIVGALTVTDPDVGDTHAFSVDDTRFEVVGGELRLKDGFSLDHEAEATVTVEVTATDSGFLEYRESFTIAVDDVNEAPRVVLQLADQTYREGAFSGIDASLVFDDPDAGDELTYSAVNLPSALVLDTETGQAVGTPGFEDAGEYSDVVFTATDRGGLSVSTDPITMRILDTNRAPTDLTLDNASVAENAPGASIGALTVIDPDVGDMFTFAVDDGRFEVAAGTLKLKDGISLDYETADSVPVKVTATDAGGLFVEETFDIAVTDVAEGGGPTDILLLDDRVAQEMPGAFVGRLRAVDPTVGATITFTTTDARFVISGDRLSLAPGVSLDFDQSPTTTVAVTASNQFGGGYTETLTIQVEDVRLPGSLDLVAAINSSTAGSRASVNFDDGSGGFGSVTGLGDAGGASAIELGDINRDGFLDAVTKTGSTFRVQFGTSTGIDGAATSYTSPLASTATLFDLLDLNGDGFLDLVNRSFDSVTILPTMEVRLNAGSPAPGSLSATITSEILAASDLDQLGDFDGDGNIDVLVHLRGDLYLYRGDGAGGFGNRSQTGSPGQTIASIARGDVDGDGDLDVVAGATRAVTYLNRGDGSFDIGPEVSLSSSQQSFQLGDVNNDGRLDLVTGALTAGSNAITVSIGDGQGAFGTPVTYQMGTGPHEVVLGDLNGDGNLDAVTSNPTDDTFGVRLGVGNGTFGSLTTVTAGADRVDLLLADLDGGGPLTDSGLPYLGPKVPHPEDFLV